jgi:hypothetical protein
MSAVAPTQLLAGGPATRDLAGVMKMKTLSLPQALGRQTRTIVSVSLGAVRSLIFGVLLGILLYGILGAAAICVIKTRTK